MSGTLRQTAQNKAIAMNRMRLTRSGGPVAQSAPELTRPAHATCVWHPAYYRALRAAFAGLVLGLFLLPPADNAHGQGTWELLPSDDMLMQRHEHGYVAVGDRFFLIGGRGERPVQEYDPATGTWHMRAPLPMEMHHFQAVAYDGRIYVMGAFTGGFPDETPIGHVYIYDPEEDAWAQGPEIPQSRRRGAAGVAAYQDQLYLVSGIQNGHMDGHVPWLDALDPATGEWRSLADAPRPRDHFQAVVLDGKLYAAAGRRSSYATGEALQLTVAEVDVYDFAADTWSTLPPGANIPTQRAGAAAVNFDGKLVVMGGESAVGLGESSWPPAHDEVEALDPAAMEWATWAPLAVGRHGIQAIVHEGRIFVASGSRTVGSAEINSHEVYVQSR